MAVNVKFNSQKAAEDLFAKFEKVKVNKQMNKEICTFLEARIRGEARRGKPFNNNRSFKSLESLTIENRNRLKAFNKTHPSFAPAKSNLTFTGQLIDAIICVFNGKANVISVNNSARKPYKTGPSSSQKNPPTNAKLYEYLLDISSGFSLFTKKGIESDDKVFKRIKSIVLKTLRRSLKVSSS